MGEVEESTLVDELIAGGENQTIDFKKVDILSNPIKLAKLMVAFANTAGGRILIGVCDDGSIEGMSAKNEHELHIMNIARDKCDPPLIPRFSVVRKPEGEIYVVKILRFQRIPRAVKTRDGKVYFIRVGSTVREASHSEIALLFEGVREELVSKQPELELLLIDEEGNASREIHTQPTIIKKKFVERSPSEVPFPVLESFTELSKQIRLLDRPGILFPKEPSQDLVSIGIEVSNVGEILAQGIQIFLKFPEDCKLFSEFEVRGGLLLGQSPSTSGGLFVDNEGGYQASAWIDSLGNDLTMKQFKKVYVRFPDEGTYQVTATITQHNFPPTDFEFSIIVKPEIIEKVEYIDDNKLV